MVINQILQKFNKYPFYYIDDYLSINDDRIGRIVSFKIYKENNIIYANFKENYRFNKSSNDKIIKINIISLEDFNIKWLKFYHNNYV